MKLLVLLVWYYYFLFFSWLCSSIYHTVLLSIYSFVSFHFIPFYFKRIFFLFSFASVLNRHTQFLSSGWFIRNVVLAWILKCVQVFLRWTQELVCIEPHCELFHWAVLRENKLVTGQIGCLRWLWVDLCRSRYYLRRFFIGYAFSGVHSEFL